MCMQTPMQNKKCMYVQDFGYVLCTKTMYKYVPKYNKRDKSKQFEIGQQVFVAVLVYAMGQN